MTWQMSTTPVLSSWIITFHQTGIHSLLIQTWQTMLLMCFFHILPKKGRLNDTYQKLKTVPHLYTYLKEEIPEEFHYKHNWRVMPIFIVVEEGWTITKNKSKIDSRGNHGYSNQFPDMHPFFLAQGPAFKEGFVSEPFENVNIYSLMCHFLGVEPVPNNGSLQAVQHLLKEHKHDYTVLSDSSQCNFCFSSFVNELWYCLIFVSKIIVE